MFVCLDVCVYFLRVFTAKMPYTQTPKTHTHLYLGGSKLTLIYDFFILNVNSRLNCEFKRSTVKQTRKMHMDVCVYGPFWRSAPHKKCRNAPYTHTHIHTHFCFLFFKASNHALCMPVFGEIDADTGQIMHFWEFSGASNHAFCKPGIGKLTQTQGKWCTFRLTQPLKA